MENKKSGTCPVCESKFSFERDVLAGELVSCSECGSDLEVIGVSGEVSLSRAPEVQEDWGE